MGRCLCLVWGCGFWRFEFRFEVLFECSWLCMYRYVYNCEGLSFDLDFWFEMVIKLFVPVGFFRGFELNPGMTSMPGLGSFRIWLF